MLKKQKITKVMKGLQKASKTHAAQAKTLKKRSYQWVAEKSTTIKKVCHEREKGVMPKGSGRRRTL